MNHTVIPTVILTIALSGCTPTFDNRGYETDSRNFTQILPNQSTRQFVEETFGSPSTVSAFPPETWTYVAKTTETNSFWPPATKSLLAYEISFDSNGIVTKIIEHNGEHAREINPVKRVTPSAGHQTSALREVFSNFGKISSKDKGSRTDR